MRAVVITKHGGPEVLQVQEREDPQAGPGQVRVAVRAAGINFADLMARSGIYPDAPPASVVGYEVAGEVESVGRGRRAAPGDRVIAGTGSGVTPSWSPWTRGRCCRCRTGCRTSRARRSS